MARDLVHYSLEAGQEFRPRGHGLVVGDAVAIKLWIARAAAELLTQREIRDTLARKPLRQRLAREPGAPAREGDRAHVGEGSHAGTREQSHETIGRKVGVADGQEIAG